MNLVLLCVPTWEASEPNSQACGLSSKFGTAIYYLGNLGDFMNLLELYFLPCKMEIMIAIFHGGFVRIKRVEVGKGLCIT